MHKKLTITLDETLYDGLHRTVGRGKISQFIASLVTPYLAMNTLEAAYLEMAADTERESEALEWCNGLIGDVADEAR